MMSIDQAQRYYDAYMQSRYTNKTMLSIIEEIKGAGLALPGIVRRSDVQAFCGLACGILTEHPSSRFYVFCVKNVWGQYTFPFGHFFFLDKPWRDDPDALPEDTYYE